MLPRCGIMFPSCLHPIEIELLRCCESMPNLVGIRGIVSGAHTTQLWSSIFVNLRILSNAWFCPASITIMETGKKNDVSFAFQTHCFWKCIQWSHQLTLKIVMWPYSGWEHCRSFQRLPCMNLAQLQVESMSRDEIGITQPPQAPVPRKLWWMPFIQAI